MFKNCFIFISILISLSSLNSVANPVYNKDSQHIFKVDHNALKRRPLKRHAETTCQPSKEDTIKKQKQHHETLPSSLFNDALKTFNDYHPEKTASGFMEYTEHYKKRLTRNKIIRLKGDPYYPIYLYLTSSELQSKPPQDFLHQVITQQQFITGNRLDTFLTHCQQYPDSSLLEIWEMLPEEEKQKTTSGTMDISSYSSTLHTIATQPFSPFIAALLNLPGTTSFPFSECLSKNDHTQWIPLSPDDICDGHSRCYPEVDENACLSCDDGQRFYHDRFCDGVKDCHDYSDETHARCQAKIESGEMIACDNGHVARWHEDCPKPTTTTTQSPTSSTSISPTEMTTYNVTSEQTTGSHARNHTLTDTFQNTSQPAAIGMTSTITSSTASVVASSISNEAALALGAVCIGGVYYMWRIYANYNPSQGFDRWLFLSPVTDLGKPLVWAFKKCRANCPCPNKAKTSADETDIF